MAAAHLTWMAAQQGFAGQLTSDAADPACFTWGRVVDLEPFTTVWNVTGGEGDPGLFVGLRPPGRRVPSTAVW
jgi:hypothetical protein